MSSSNSSSLLPQDNYSAIKDRVLNVLMSGLMERIGRKVPVGISEELVQMYILEYVALQALKEAQSKKVIVDSAWEHFDTSHIDARIEYLQNIFRSIAGSLTGPYSAYVQDFSVNNSSKALRSYPDHKEVYDKIYNVFTMPSQFVTSQYLAKGVKRRGGRRKTQYRSRSRKITRKSKNRRYK